MKKIFTLTALLVVALAVNAQGYRKWDFTNWSAQTIANLQADAATSSTEGWSDIEKAADAGEGKVAPEATANNCFWLTNGDGGTLKANGVEIAETEGLVFNSTYTSKRSLAIAVNYPTTSLGEYAGPQYLWLGGGNAKSASARIACFTIPKVRIGQKITIVAESHNPSQARGVSLFVNSCTDDANQIGESFKPTTQETYTWEDWTLPAGVEAEGETVDIIVYNTNGCHIYSIEIGDDTQKSKVGYLYNGTLDSELAYPIISSNELYTVEPLEANGAFTQDALTAYDVVVISSTLNNAEAIASLKSIQPFVPTLNLNPALYEAWGYGTIGTAEHQFAQLTSAGHALFRNLELVEEDEIVGLQITNNSSFKGVVPAGYFAKDQVLATVMESEDVAIHAHNMGHNGYLFIPYTQEVLADAASPELLGNAIRVLSSTKAKVSQAPKPTISLTYKNFNTDVTLKSTVTGAQIFYTTDGSVPTEQSTPYTEPFNISQEGVTVKAVALGDGYLLSDVAEQLIDLKEQAAAPTFQLTKEEGKTTVTISGAEGTTIYYNYTGKKDVKESSLYKEPVVISRPKLIYAFATIEGKVDSEVASEDVVVNNPKLRLDVLSHMDANSADYNNGSTSTVYYFSWGRNKSGENGYPYYNPEVYTVGESTIDPETGDEIEGKKTYTEPNPEQAIDFETGWMLRSRGQIVDWENLTSGTNYGDNQGYNFATVEDNDPDFPATKGLINLADKNTEPTDASFPYNAYIVTTQKFKGPFDVVAYVGSIVKPENEAKHQFVIQTATDGNVWESNWQTVGDSILIEGKQRLTTKVVRSYEGEEEVYVRLYLSNFNSKIGLYDIYIANSGEKTQDLLTGVEEVKQNTEAAPAEIFSLNGMRSSTLKRGLNIVRYSNGTIRKVMVK